MVISIDGVVAVDGRVGGLTGTADQRLLLGMRERAQAVVVGAATVRAEGPGGLLPGGCPATATAGLSPQPELAVVTRSPDGIAGTEAALAPDLQVRLEQPPTNRDGTPDLRVVSAGIREQAERVSRYWEGGPTIVRMAIAQGVLCDELFFAISPMLAGRGLPLAGPETGGTRRLRLIATAASEDFLFLRYGLGTT